MKLKYYLREKRLEKQVKCWNKAKNKLEQRVLWKNNGQQQFGFKTNADVIQQASRLEKSYPWDKEMQEVQGAIAKGYSYGKPGLGGLFTRYRGVILVAAIELSMIGIFSLAVASDNFFDYKYSLVAGMVGIFFGGGAAGAIILDRIEKKAVEEFNKWLMADENKN